MNDHRCQTHSSGGCAGMRLKTPQAVTGLPVNLKARAARRNLYAADYRSAQWPDLSR